MKSSKIVALFVKGFVMAISMMLVACGSVIGSSSVAGSKSEQGHTGTGGRPVVLGSETNNKVVSIVWQDKFSFVRIEQNEGAAINDHPVDLAPMQIRTVLTQLQVQKAGSQPQPLFTAKTVDRIVDPIAKALNHVEPDQDVVFALTDNKRPLLLFSEDLATTGRLFYKDGELNLLFGVVNSEFQDQFRATGYIRPFATGSRNQRQEQRWAIVPAEGMRYASADRKDWLQIDSLIWEQSIDVPIDGSQPSVTAMPAQNAVPSAIERPAKSSPDGTPSTTDKTIVGASTHYQHFEKRLKTLRELRKNGLITDEEYQNKRRAILNEL